MNLNDVTMKKWIFLCAIALAVTACNKREFTIEGRVTDADGQILYLESLASGQPEVLESVALDKEGSFKFTQEAPQYPEFYQLRLNESLVHFAIDSTETLTFSARVTDFADGYELTGSDECTKMRIVTDESGKLKKRINELSRAIESKSSQVDSLRQQAVQALAEYKKKMFNLVLENPASATSYYIVFQEINGDKIFDPYNAEDRKLIAAVATGFDMRYPESPRSKQLKEMTLGGHGCRAGLPARATRPDIEAETASYIDVELYDQLGRKQTLGEQVEANKVVLLSFHGLPDRVFPGLQHEAGRTVSTLYRSRGLEIYQVSLDADEQAVEGGCRQSAVGVRARSAERLLALRRYV